MHKMTAIARPFFLSLALILLAVGAIIGFLAAPSTDSAPMARPLVVFVLDASTSMLAATDGGDRLSQARKAIAELANALKDTDVALVTFGGDALADFPPSPDHDGFLAALDAITPTLSFSPGSDPASGLTLAQELSAGRQAVAVLFTDGEFNVPESTSEQTVWLSRTIPLAWRVVGMGPAMPIPLGGSWFRDPDTGEIALSQAQDTTLKNLVDLSDAPSVNLSSAKTPSACSAAVSSLIESKDALPLQSSSRLSSGVLSCSVLAAILILATMLVGHFSHAPTSAMTIILCAIALTSCTPKQDDAHKQAARLTYYAAKEWELSNASKQPSEALGHIRRGLALCREAFRLVPHDKSAAANLQLFLSREAQLTAPQDEAPAAAAKDSSSDNAPDSHDAPTNDKKAHAQPDTVADDVLGLAGDAAPSRSLPDELRKKSDKPQQPSDVAPRNDATADAWRTLLHKERGMRKRPQNVKPW